MENLLLARAARKTVVNHLKEADDPSALVEIEPVGVAGYAPDRHVLHEGRVGRLGPRITDLAHDLRDEVELRSALVAITGLDPKKSTAVKLSPKEILYLDMICDGISDLDAAKRLSISLRAVKARKKVICEKTQSTTINQAIAKYMRTRKTRYGPALPALANEAAALMPTPKPKPRRTILARFSPSGEPIRSVHSQEFG